ncbi:MAG: DUF5723 family protein [Bacteroidota bacterium]
MKLKVIVLLSWLLVAGAVSAQHEMSAFTATGRAGVSTTLATDYQSLGINPANLGMINSTGEALEKPQIISLGLAETAISVHSDALSKSDLARNLFSLNAAQGGDSLTTQEKAEAALTFANSGIELNADVMSIGLAITPSRKVGGFALGVRDRFSSSFQFNGSAADILFNGYNSAYFDSLVVINDDTTGFATQPVLLSDLFGGSRFTLNWYREIHLAYGRVLVDQEAFKLYAGVGAKYLMGLGYMDVDVRDGFDAFTALGPVFNVDYGNNLTPSAVTNGLVGNGLGFDAGITVSLLEDERLKIGASITDIGQMTWDGNVYRADDTLVQSIGTEGVNSYNLIDELENFSADSNYFSWEGAQEIQVSLPTLMRLGASFRIVDQLQVGADLIVPFNESVASFDNAIFALGVDVQPAPFFRFSTGISTGAEYDFSIPVGIYFSAPLQVYEVGIASRDLVTFFTQNSPNLSVAFGFFRFKF